MNIKEALQVIVDDSESNSFVEICGFLGFDREKEAYVVQIQKNVAEDPSKHFMIDPLDYLFFKEKYDLLAVYHSHINTDAEPSEFDVKMSNNCCIPFLIYSIETKKFDLYEPQNLETDVNTYNRFKEDYDNY
ncbi:Mov34/MPN/PAD-1 family protein [Candidatus Pelagibacter sp.]|nr:Mov34/MPN/PAD-1 family protein [Candidatus Pelagibacter sp.]|tara:strand:+ start:3396 stop:3791 length:396 start_codon:yes stop_codon:yes gene_type:complete